MEKKEWITAAALTAAVFALWFAFNTWYNKTHPPVATSQTAPQTTPADTEPAATEPSATMPTTLASGTTNPSAASMSAGVHASPSTQPSGEPVMLGSAQPKDSTYSAQVAIEANGAAISSVTLNGFNGPDSAKDRTAKTRALYRFQEPVTDHPETASMATRSLVIDGKGIDLWDVPWTLASSTPSSAVYTLYVDDGSGNHVAQLTKRYSLGAKTDPSKGYELSLTQSIANVSDKPIKLHFVLNGTTPLPSESLQGIDRSIVVGMTDAGPTASVVLHPDSDFKPSGPEIDLSMEGKRHYVWTGQQSSYFAAIVLPTDKPGDSPIVVHAIALNPNATAASATESRQVTLQFFTPDVTLAPGAASEQPFSVYLGPKWRDVLDTPYYNTWPRMYNLFLVVKSSLCGWFAFPWLISTLVFVLGLFHLLLRDWGLAIICLVLLVRALLHPITKRSQVQMMKMGKLAPEVERLKKKYADQPDVLNREMMQLYKQQGGAVLGCLPMFLQTPIWIALWSALQSTFELRQAPFFYGMTWIHDLARPDTLLDMTRVFGGPLPLYIFGWHLYAINVLPMCMAVVTYVNQRYFMPMPIAATPEQEQQQKMQRGMSMLFPLMFYNMPSGLNLYYLTSMSLGIIESKYIRDHIKEQEELAKARGPELVPMRPTRTSRRNAGKIEEDKTPEKPSLVDRFLSTLQKAQQQAEEMKKGKEKDKR